MDIINNEDLLNYFENKETIRENALKLSREIVRKISMIIRNIHKNPDDFNILNSIKNEITLIEEDILRLREMLKDYDDLKKYINTPEIEYVECKTFLEIVFSVENGCKSNNSINRVDDVSSNNNISNNMPISYKTFKKVGIIPENYILGLCDVIGELRRIIVECIKEDDIDRSMKYFEIMEKIYEYIMLFDNYHVIDGLRRKQDISRGILEKTNGDIMNFIENLKLRRELIKLNGVLKSSN